MDDKLFYKRLRALSWTMKRIGHNWGPWRAVNLLGLSVTTRAKCYYTEDSGGIVTRRFCYRCGIFEEKSPC